MDRFGEGANLLDDLQKGDLRFNLSSRFNHNVAFDLRVKSSKCIGLIPKFDDVADLRKRENAKVKVTAGEAQSGEIPHVGLGGGKAW